MLKHFCQWKNAVSTKTTPISQRSSNIAEQSELSRVHWEERLALKLSSASSAEPSCWKSTINYYSYFLYSPCTRVCMFYSANVCVEEHWWKYWSIIIIIITGMVHQTSGVAKVGVTLFLRHLMVSPYFSSKNWTDDLFLVIALCKVMTFSAVVSSPLPPSDVVCPVFFLNSAAKKLISFGCLPLNGVTRGGQPPATS